MGGCSTFTKNVSVPLLPKAKIDPQLNRLNNRQINILKEKFRMAIGKEKKIALDKRAFINIFPGITKIPKVVIDSAFKAFDQDNSGDIDFREFCYSISILCLADLPEKLEFVFQMFDIQKIGFHLTSDTFLLFKTLIILYKISNSNIGNLAQIDNDSLSLSKQEKQWIESKCKSLHDKNPKITVSQFIEWATPILDVNMILQPFELLQSPLKEKQIISRIFKDTAKKTGDTWYVLSHKWWEMYQIYLQFSTDVNEQKNYIQQIYETIQKEDSEFFQITKAVPSKDNKIRTPTKGLDELTNLHASTPTIVKPDSLANIHEDNLFQHSDEFHVYNSNSKSQYSTPTKTIGMRNTDLGTLPSTGQKTTGIMDFDRRVQLNSRIKGSVHLKKRFLPDRKKIVGQSIDSQIGRGLTNPVLRTSVKQFSNIVGERPCEIDNNDIEGDFQGQLKPNLLPNRDFILIPEEGWKNLIDWYGGGPSFPRKVIIVGENPTIELYPPQVNIMLCGADGHGLQDSCDSLYVSEVSQLEKLKVRMQKKYQITDTNVRLWFKRTGDDWQLMSNLTENIEDLGVKSGDSFLLEMKLNNTWPRDAKGANEKQWRNFEVGDKIDIFDNRGRNPDWKVGRIIKVLKDTIKIHFENEKYKNDIIVPKNIQHLAPYGTKTLSTHIKALKSMNIGTIPKDIVGIYNIGNTCYMNCILQCLLNIQLLRHYFLSNLHLNHLNKKKSHSQGNIALGFGVLMREYMTTKQISIYPREFKKVVNKYLPQFCGSEQHDAQEFLSFLLDSLSEDLNKEEKEPSSPVKQIADHKNEVNNITSSTNKEDDSSKYQIDPVKKQKTPKKEAPSQSGGGAGGKQKQSPFIDSDLETERMDIIDQNNPPNKIALVDRFKKRVHDDSVTRKLSSHNTNYNNDDSFSSPINSSLPPINPNKHRVPNSLVASEDISGKFETPIKTPVFPKEEEKKMTREELGQSEWKKIEEAQNSVINDLFGGQTCTTIKCPKCQTTTYKFEKFFSVSVPIPISERNTYIINLVKRSRLKEAPFIMKYAVSINKKSTLDDLLIEIEKATRLRQDRLHLVEVYNNKIIKVFFGDTKASLKQLGLRHKLELFAFEVIKTTADADRNVQYVQYQYRQTKQKDQEFKEGELIDVKDTSNNWCVGRIVRKFTSQEGSIRKTYFQINYSQDLTVNALPNTRPYPIAKKYDYFEVNSEKLAPYLSHTKNLTEGVLIWNVVMRYDKMKRTSKSKNAYTYYDYLPFPFAVGIATWYTWRNVFVEIATQALKYVKNKPAFAETIDAIKHNKRGSIPIVKSNTHAREQTKLSSQYTNFERKLPDFTPSKKEKIGNPSEYYDLPFKIIILDEHSQCPFCSAKTFSMDYFKSIKCTGCELPISNEIIKEKVQFFGRVTVYLEWENLKDFQEAVVTNDVSFLEMQEEEKAVTQGYSLEKCIDLFTNEEALSDYQCEKCKENVKAKVHTSFSRLPDYLIVHLKRFAFEDQYLEKLDTYIQCPLNSLNMSQWLISSKMKSSNSYQYELQSVANHHSYSVGGHYTTVLHHRMDSSTEESKEGVEPKFGTTKSIKWFVSDDETIKEIKKEDVISKDAYILLYKKKDLAASNIVNLTYQSVLYQ